MYIKNKYELIDTLIRPEDEVLDVGFWGQGIPANDPDWIHKILKNRARIVYGLDIDYDDSMIDDPRQYFRANAETFSVPKKFDVIFAGDLIEHLSNPGLFLESCKRHIRPGGRIIITTPNAYGFFVMASKITRYEPPVNSDHTMYFTIKVLEKLLNKNGLYATEKGFMYTAGVKFKQSWKKKILNILHRMLWYWTPKFGESIFIVATTSK